MKMTYAVVIEQTANNYGAYAPDVPGCISTAQTTDEILTNIREALAFHIDGLLLGGDPVPVPQMSIEDAVAYHTQALSDSDEAWPTVEGEAAVTLSTRYELVDVEVSTARATAAS